MRKRVKRLLPGENARMILIAAVIGLLAGGSSILMRSAVTLVREALFLTGHDLLGIGQGGLHLIFLPLLPAAGMVLLIPLSRLFPGEVNGYGFPNFLRRVNLEGGVIPLRTVFIRIVGTALTIGSGGSAGVEGPIAQVGGTLGSQVGRLTRVSGERMKVYVAAGCAGGVAAMFNAPIAGIFFAAEIVLLGTYEVSSFAAMVISSAMATVVSQWYFGSVPAFRLPDYHLLAPLVEIPLYSLMGVVIGMLAVLHLTIFYRVRDYCQALPLPPQLKPVVGALVVGTIGIGFPQVMGDGYDFISSVLHGQGAMVTICLLIVLKMLATAVTLGSGGTGGVFAPALFIGAMIGGSFGTLVHGLWPTLTASPGAYAAVGIGAFLAASTHAPLTAIFLLFEMTGNYLIIVPIMVSSIIGVVMAAKLKPDSIDTEELSRQGVDLHEGREVALMKALKVGRVMSEEVDFISEKATIDELLTIFGMARGGFYFPVIDERGRMTGIVSLQDAKTLLQDEKLRRGATVGEVCNRQVVFLTPDDTVLLAMRLFDRQGIEEIPVVESGEERWVLGMLKRRDVVLAYNRELIRRGMAAGEG